MNDSVKNRRNRRRYITKTKKENYIDGFVINCHKCNKFYKMFVSMCLFVCVPY